MKKQTKNDHPIIFENPTKWERRTHRLSHAWTPWSEPEERTVRTFLESGRAKIKVQNRRCKVCNLQEENIV
jgi:hypothetical protein